MSFLIFLSSSRAVPSFHVAHEIHRFCLLKEPVCLAAYVVSLFGLFSHVQKSGSWIPDPIDILHVEGGHDGELAKVRTGYFNIGSAVADANNPPVHGGKDGAEGRADDTGNAAQPHQSTRYERARGAG